MAAYAAVISFKHTFNRLKDTLNIPQPTKSAINEALDSLVSTLKILDDSSYRGIDRSRINELDAQIREAVWKLEDLLEPYVFLSHSLPPEGEIEIEFEFESFLNTVKKLREKFVIAAEDAVAAELKPLSGEDAVAADPAIPKSTVGLSDLSEKIRKELVDDGTPGVQTISLVGMAGIGKTHLATLVYHDKLILQHFDLRVWVRVGPKDPLIENMFVDILAQIERRPREMFKGKSMSALKCLLRYSLDGMRCLIVLDDTWSTKVLDHFRSLQPGKSEGGLYNLSHGHHTKIRILLTTRLHDVAYNWGGKIELSFLNNEESWDLLWRNVFVDQESFPSHLEKLGRKIAENCEGLPLLILTVANILRGLDKTEEYWKMVAEKKTTTFREAYDQIYPVLISSYDYLPQHLKPCFLYMGAFPQSFEIPISKLINLWDVEDILEPSLDEKLEHFAKECVQGLVSNSVAIACKRSFKRVRRIKSLKLHSTYWHLCVKEAKENKYLHVLNKLNDVSGEKQRRLAFQNNILFGLKEVYDSMVAATSTTRSLLCTGEYHQYPPIRICLNMMLLKVLDALAIRFYEFPEEVMKLLQLKYLTLTHNGELPRSISRLQQLQHLILRRHHNIKLLHKDPSCLPEEIWDMQELRHVRITGSNLPDPRKGEKLPKLSTLYVNAVSCTEEVFKSIPNLKKLGIKLELHPDAAETVTCFEHIGLLEKLESLKCVVVNPRVRSHLVVAPPEHLSNLPQSLKKLSLNGLEYSWEYMSAIASLPCLKVLKLRCSAFRGPHWETEVHGKFWNLEYLLLEDVDLLHWTKGMNYFTSLRHLIVRHCYKLKKMPLEIGDIIYLKTLEVDDCSPSVVDSAFQIKENSESSDLQVVINTSW